MEVPLPWERLLWRGRPWSARGERYALTDFRLVRLHRARPAEIALYDICDVRSVRTALDRVLGTSTLIVGSRRGEALRLHHVRRGIQLQSILEILAGDTHESVDASAMRAALHWRSPTLAIRMREPLLLCAAIVAAVFGVAIGAHGKPAGVMYPDDDAIYPAGVKRDRDSVVQFMEMTVLPWARTALAPIVGGADRVSCETCHGAHAEARDWRMPAVAALPKPDVIDRGWERYGGAMDAQMRNAIYGYLAESEKQSKAAYMREIVMPGMARLLRRPAYDFTQTYEYNRTHFAFGCYHCHQVK
jgi:hypothetical protein